MAKDVRLNGCVGSCVALSVPSSAEAKAPALTEAHFPCVWRVFAGAVDGHVRRCLRELGINRTAARIREWCPAVAFSPNSAVRIALSRDEGLVAELSQEVAIALLGAVRRGAVRAAAPVVACWLMTAVPRIVRRRVRAAVILAITAAPTDDARCEPPVGPVVHLEAYEFGADERGAFRVSCVTPLLADLTESERTVFASWRDGEEVGAIARRLSISRTAASLRLMRAKRRIRRGLRED